MARRSRGEEDDVSLFPFLSILACVIGTLTLMISGLALGQMDNDTVASAEEFQRVSDELAATQQQIADVQQQIDSEKQNAADTVTERQRELADARVKLAKLSEDLDAQKENSRQSMQVIAIPNVDRQILQTIEQLKAEIAQHQQRIAQLKAEVAERKLPPRESQVKVMPGGSGVGFQPLFVECAAGSIVLHNKPNPLRVPAGQIRSNKPFADLLQEVAADENKSVIFLIRTDGLASYRAAQAMANSRDVRNGKLPVLGKGRLDLAYFANGS